jgi:dipeptidase
MKETKKPLFALAALALSLAAPALAGTRPGDDCFTVLVGRKASADGSVIVAHNEDDPGDIVVNVRKIHGRDHGATRRVALGHGATYETDGRVAGFLWIEATGQEFADSFVNDFGVVVTSDSCPSRETADDLTDGGIGYMLRRLLAEKARTAREAVKLAGELIEKYGYRGSGRTYSVADKDEAWMIAVIRGRHWFAERVPDDEVAVIPNWYTIRRIRTDVPAEFAGSPDIVAYARARGWYDEAKGGAFDFKTAFQRPGRPDPILDGNTLRNWRGLAWLSGRDWEKNGDYPFSFKPAKKVSAESLLALLRDHYEGTPFDATEGYKTGTPNHTKYRTICTTSTIASFVASLNGRRPAPVSAMVWLALGRPDSTAFLPVYGGVDDLPAGAGLGPREHDDVVLYAGHFDDSWLRAERDKLLGTKVGGLARAVEADYGRMILVARGALGPAEASFVKGRKGFEAEFASLYAKDKAAAQKVLDAHVAAAFAEVSGLYDRLAAKPEDPGLSADAQARADIAYLRAAAKKLLDGCLITASDGTPLYTPDGRAHYAALWTRDFASMVEYAGDLMSLKNIESCIDRLVKAVREDGAVPDRVQVDGRAVYAAGAADSPLGEPNIDNAQFLVFAAAGCLEMVPEDMRAALYRKWSPALVRGMDWTPRGANGLVWNDPRKPHSPYGFTDTVAKTGDLFMESVLYWRAAKILARWEGLYGSGATRDGLLARAAAIERSIGSLWDETTGMFLAASVDCRQTDIWGNAYAVAVGFPPAGRRDRIVDYLVSNYDRYVWHGQVRHLPRGEYWQRQLYPVEKDRYQNGAFWGTASGWVMEAVAGRAPELALRMFHDLVEDFRAGGICECVNEGYRQLESYVDTATNPLGAAGRLWR